MAYTPPRSACFRPERYDDMALFADRKDARDDLTETLHSYLEAPDPEACVLVRGSRGVGKSMLARHALKTVLDRWEKGVLYAEADCARLGTGPVAVLRALAQSLANAVQRDTDGSRLADIKDLGAAARVLERIARMTTVKAKETRTWQQELNVGVSAKSSLLDKTAFEFGWKRVAGRSKQVEETFERQVDTSFLCELLTDFVDDCRGLGEHAVLLFVDNLDQAAYVDRPGEVREVLDLARILLGLRRAIVVMTLRSEFASRDLPKYESRVIDLDGMAPAALTEVAHARMAVATDAKRQALAGAGVDTLISILAGWTPNPWAFLVWLSALDYERQDLRGASAAQVHATLRTAIRARFAPLAVEDLDKLGAAYRGVAGAFRSRAELESAGVGAALLEQAASLYALIPEWILDPEPNRFELAPQLHFLAL